VLYSRNDRVLHWAFSLGETVAGEGFFPTAVGRFGQPPGTWIKRQELGGHDHGDYWGDPRAAALVARLLGVAVSREIESAAMAARKLPEATDVAGRQIATRTMPVRTGFEA
jgi:hypothetical protein